jgi:hypothetical protein
VPARKAVTPYRCGSSSSCSSPEVVGSAMLSGAGRVAEGAISSATVAAGDYVSGGFSAGKCSQLNFPATAQVRVEQGLVS